MHNNLPGSDGEHILQENFQTLDKAQGFYKRQMIDYLAPKMQDFIKNQEMMFISTADKKGMCDCSLRTGKLGFVSVLDEKTLIYPEFKGNGVMASMGNISENPYIGLLFLDFLEDKVGLHVNAEAKILQKDELHKYLKKEHFNIIEKIKIYNTKRDVAWLLLKVDEAYIHCSKNIPMFVKNLDKSIEQKVCSIDYFELQKENR